MGRGPYVATAIPCARLDSAVLEVLAQTESGLGVSQIARLAGRGTRQGLAPILDRLVEHGVVLADPAVRGYLYRLNRDHVLAESVLGAARARITIVARLTEAVQALTPRPVHVSVFGSFARREAGPGSDIDVLVVLPADAVADERLVGADATPRRPGACLDGQPHGVPHAHRGRAAGRRKAS